MLSLHSFLLIAIGAFIVLGLVGGIFCAAARSGWMKNDYFSLPSVILIVLVLYILFQGIGSGVTGVVIGEHFENHPIAVLTINGLTEIVVLLIGAVAISRTVRQNLLAVFRLEGIRETPITAYLLAVPIMLLAQFGGSALSILIERVWKFFPSAYSVIDKYETAGDETMKGLVTAHGRLEFILILLFVAIVPALAEEALFRGFVQTNIERSGNRHTRPYVALIVASIFFAMVHGSIFKFPGLLALGLTLGWLTYRTNNLFTGALGHAINNGFIVVALYLNPMQISSKANANLVSTDELSGTDALVLLVLIIPGIALCLYLFNRITAHLQSRGNAERELQSRLEQENALLNGTIIMNDYLPHHYE